MCSAFFGRARQREIEIVVDGVLGFERPCLGFGGAECGDERFWARLDAFKARGPC